MSHDTPLISRRRPRVAVATPELHRLGGTERVTAEQVERWSLEFDVRVFVSRMIERIIGDPRFAQAACIERPRARRDVHLGRERADD